MLESYVLSLILWLQVLRRLHTAYQQWSPAATTGPQEYTKGPKYHAGHY